jgi:1,5-anhydro-D-fructose reductase (1,5-anhydro-D-mannitol-forming)
LRGRGKTRVCRKADAIGPVRTVVARQFQRLPPAEQIGDGKLPWRINPALSGGGFFFEMVCHTLDFFDYLLGPIESVRAFADNQAKVYAPEDVVTASYRFASGAYGSGTWCFTADFEEEYNEIIGAKVFDVHTCADSSHARSVDRGDCDR